MGRRNRVVLANRSQSIDLEFTTLDIEAGRTYEDDGTTVFESYIVDGLRSGAFELAKRQPDTILVHHPDA